jgi:hypothetical protein
VSYAYGEGKQASSESALRPREKERRFLGWDAGYITPSIAICGTTVPPCAKRRTSSRSTGRVRWWSVPIRGRRSWWA